MTFKLTPDEIDAGKAAIQNHGVTVFLPLPPEWNMILADWEETRKHVSELDLDTRKAYPVQKTFFKKNSRFIRPIEMLHAEDLLIYTSLVMILRDSIEASRLEPHLKKSFSYRAQAVKPGYLYKTSGQYQRYRDRTDERIRLAKTKFVTTLDIAQFFPNIYQHRLENALQAAAQSQRQNEAIRVLSKQLTQFSEGKSYGIPTGPFASRNLSEALLIDVDAQLHAKGIDFVRWMDDFTFFTKTQDEAVQLICFISSWLHLHHGLIINQEKTRIYSKDNFIAEVWKTYDQEHKTFRNMVRKIKNDLYDDDLDDTAEDISADDLLEIFNLAMTIGDEPKYGLIGYILENVIFRPEIDEETRVNILTMAMERFSDLEPLFSSIAKALAKEPAVSNSKVSSFCSKVFTWLKAKQVFVTGHLEAWLHWLIGERKLVNLKPKLLDRLKYQRDPVVRREIFVALAQIGDRADVLFVKAEFATFGSSERLPAILASRKFGADERKHWRNASNITDRYEKAAFSI